MATVVGVVSEYGNDTVRVVTFEGLRWFWTEMTLWAYIFMA